MTDITQVLDLTHPTAEITVLTAMRRGATDDAIYMADNLSAADFSDPRRRIVFQAMVNVLRGVEPLDDSAVLAECTNVARDMRLEHVKIEGGYLAGLDGDPLRAKAYAATVKRMAWLRQAGEFVGWWVGKLQERPDPEQLFAEAQERMQALQPPQVDRRFVYGWDTVGGHQAQLAQRVKDAEEGKPSPFLWPWPSWNAVVRPLRAGMLGLVAGADGTGKSTYLECIAEHWAKGGMHVVYVHLEDDLEYKLDRRLARWARVPLPAIEDGRLSQPDQNAIAIAQASLERQANTLHYFHAPGMSMTEIVRELESKAAEGVCQAVVLDYLDKVQPSRSQVKLFGDNMWERQGADVEALKIFAEKNKMPVLTASQGNKQMQDSGIRTRKDITGSGAKTQKAQMVAILTREIVGKEGLKDEQGRVLADPGEYSPFIDLRIDKQNRGKQGVTIRQFLIGQYFDIRDVMQRRIDE